MLSGIETNRHLPQLANIQTVQYSTTILSNNRENRNTRVPRLNRPELPSFQQAILETIEENSSRPSSSNSGNINTNSRPAVIANSTPPAQAPDSIILNERSLQRETTPGLNLSTYTQETEETNLSNQLNSNLNNSNNPMFSPDVQEVRQNASAPPPTYSLSEERGILGNNGRSAIVNEGFENDCHENEIHGDNDTNGIGNSRSSPSNLQ